MGRHLAALLASAGLIAGCAPLAERVDPAAPAGAVPAAASPNGLTPFSLGPGAQGPHGWREWRFHPTKRLTRYRSVELEGQRVLEASADRSVSGLMHAVDVDPVAYPILEWRWRVDAPIAGSDVADRYADDAPARIVLAFDGDKSALPLKEQMFFERVKLLAGHDMPYATLMYVWCSSQDREAVVPNAHTTRVRKIVVESGPQGAAQWRVYRRDIVADYERAYGRKPGRLLAVGVLTDADNTGQTVRSLYGDVKLLAR
jgi:hypothetical protein